MQQWGIQTIFRWEALHWINSKFIWQIQCNCVTFSSGVLKTIKIKKRALTNFYPPLHIKSPLKVHYLTSHFLSRTHWLHKNGIVFRGECEKKCSLIALYIQTGKGVEKWCSRFHLTELENVQPFPQPLRWKRTWRLCFVNGTQRHIPAPQCWRALLKLRQEWANGVWTDG